jgi:hypothetical protein
MILKGKLPDGEAMINGRTSCLANWQKLWQQMFESIRRIPEEKLPDHCGICNSYWSSALIASAIIAC